MKNIVIFLDGTRNTAKAYAHKNESTHIRKVFNLICQHEDMERVQKLENYKQIEVLITSNTSPSSSLAEKKCVVIYIEGIRNLVDAGLGIGVLERARIAHKVIADFYERGDQIFIYGFSRGAASALCLAHYINDFGIQLNRPMNLLKFPEWLAKKTELSTNFYDIALRKLPCLFADGHRPMQGPVASLCLVDTVFATNECDPNTHKWLKDVTGIANSITHFLAKHEERGSFTPLILKSGVIDAERLSIFEKVQDTNAIPNGNLYLGKVDERKCLHQHALDGSHSDIGGFYDSSALGLPVFAHILSELQHANIPFNTTYARIRRSQMKDLIIRQENGYGWRVLSSLGSNMKWFDPFSKLTKAENRCRGFDYKRDTFDSFIRKADPTCGELESQFGKFFVMPYSAVKSTLLKIMLSDQKLGLAPHLDFFDFTEHSKLGVILDAFDNTELEKGCLFYYRQVDVEMESVKKLNPALSIKIANTSNEIVNFKKRVSLFKKLWSSYEKELILYNSPEYNKLSEARLYRGNHHEDNLENNTLVRTNVKVLKLIKDDIMAVNQLAGSRLEEIICRTFSISSQELNNLTADLFISHDHFSPRC